MTATTHVDTVAPFANILLGHTSLERRCREFLGSDERRRDYEEFVDSIDDSAFGALRKLGYAASRAMLLAPLSDAFVRQEARRVAWGLTRDWMNRGSDTMVEFGSHEVTLDGYFVPLRTDGIEDAKWNRHMRRQEKFLRHNANDLAIAYPLISVVLGEAHAPTVDYLSRIGSDGYRITSDVKVFLHNGAIAMRMDETTR